MTRPTDYHPDRPATAAERKRRERARRQMGLTPTPTVRKIAESTGASLRHQYHIRQYLRHRTFDWEPSVTRLVGASFVADVCKNSSPKRQRYIYELVKRRGAREARLQWRAYLRVARTGCSTTWALEEERRLAAERMARGLAKAKHTRHRHKLFLASFKS